MRARETRDLDALRQAVQFLPSVEGNPERVEVWKELELMVTPHTVTRYRFILNPAALGEVMAALENSVDTTNFKSAIAPTNARRHKEPALHEIWEIMFRFQQEEKQGDDEFIEDDLMRRSFE